MPTYLDTSALAKWYMPEARSEDFAEFIRTEKGTAISRLTVLEMRSVLSRRRRMQLVDAAEERRAWTAFRQDLKDGMLEVHAVIDADFEDATDLIERLRAHPLRSLDSLHIAIARRLSVEAIATADQALSAAARSLGLTVAWFGPP